jgi:hypothetical protein
MFVSIAGWHIPSNVRGIWRIPVNLDYMPFFYPVWEGQMEVLTGLKVWLATPSLQAPIICFLPLVTASPFGLEEQHAVEIYRYMHL